MKTKILTMGFLVLTFSIKCIAQEYGEWHMVYGEPNGGKVEISFKVRGCAGSPYSFFRLNNTIQTQYFDLLDFKFEYIDCDNNISYENVHLNLSQDKGLINDLGMWFIGKQVTKIIGVKFKAGFDRPKNNNTNPTSNHQVYSNTNSNNNYSSNNQNNSNYSNTEQNNNSRSQNTNQSYNANRNNYQQEQQRQQAEQARQQELENQRREAEAQRLQQQANLYLQQAQDNNNTAIMQSMYLNQAKINLTEQRLKGSSPEDLASQQQQINEIQTQQTQQNIENLTNTMVGVIGLWGNAQRERQERREREEAARRQEALEEAMKTPEQRQREREEAERRRIEQERIAAEQARIREIQQQEFLKEVKFNMQLQYGLGMDNIPIIVNDEISRETGIHKTFHPIANIGVQSNILDHQGVSFHVTPRLSYGRNMFEKRRGSHLSYGLDAMVQFGKRRGSTFKFFLEGALLKRKGNYQSQSGSIFDGATTTPASVRKAEYTYGIVRYGGGIMLNVGGGGLYNHTFFKPGVFLERLSFFDANNKSAMVGNLQVLISNSVIIDLSYSRHYPISGEIAYPETIEQGNQDYYSVKIFLRTTLIK